MQFRGAVRPPFIEAWMNGWMDGCGVAFRGAVRPPFIEAKELENDDYEIFKFRGAVRPPFIEAAPSPLDWLPNSPVSGGSPPPLH